MNKDEALKMAIEALQNNQTYDWKGNPLTALDEANEKIINACKEALEQPAQEPVAWEWFEDRAYYDMYAVKQVGNKNFDEVIHVLKSKDAKYLCDWLNSLNIHPAQPLSDDEIYKLKDKHTSFYLGNNHLDVLKFARAIEQAHGIGVKDETSSQTD